MKKYTLLLLLSFVVLFAEAKKIAPRAPLTGKYTLVKQSYKGKMQMLSGVKSTISLDQSRETISCFMGCNTLSGDFSAIGNFIEPLQLMSTEKFCSSKIDKAEKAFVKNMGAVNHFKIRSREVFLYHDEELLIVLRRK